MDESYGPRPEVVPIIEKVKKMVGYVPLGTVDLLYILAHPDVIQNTRDFLDDCSREDSR